MSDQRNGGMSLAGWILFAVNTVIAAAVIAYVLWAFAG